MRNGEKYKKRWETMRNNEKQWETMRHNEKQWDTMLKYENKKQLQMMRYGKNNEKRW